MKAEQNDSSDIYNFLLQTFYKTDPIFSAFEPLSYQETYDLKTLAYNHSFKAVDNQNQIIGVSLNQEVDEEQERPPSTNANTNKIYDLFDFAEREMGGSLISGLLAVSLSCVEKSYLKKGIQKKLLEETEKYGLHEKFSGIKVICTNKPFADVLKSKNYRSIYSLEYKDYTDKNGDPIFVPPAPHKKLEVFVKRFSVKPRKSKALSVKSTETTMTN